MTQGSSRSGLTLVELLVASTIFVVIFSALASSFVGGIRLLKATFATAEMSLRTRDLRDRLLFHAAPPHNDAMWAGLLSYTNLVDASGKGRDVLVLSDNKIQMRGTGLKSDSSATDEDFVLTIAETVFSYENAALSTCWLNPSDMNLLADSGKIAPLAWAKKSDGTYDNSRFYIYLSGRVDIAGLPVEHNERIVVPVFGKPQRGGLDL